MTSQLTPEHTRSLPSNIDEANERILLQPWFWLALLSMIAIVFVTVAV